jgi:hypothetical protein
MVTYVKSLTFDVECRPCRVNVLPSRPQPLLRVVSVHHCLDSMLTTVF